MNRGSINRERGARHDRSLPGCHRRGRIRGDSRIPQAGTAGKGRRDVVLVNPTDYFLYLPLLPEVEAGILNPCTVAAQRLDHVAIRA
jgi:hypothetical protein